MATPTKRYFSNVATPMFIVGALDGVSLTSTSDVSATAGGGAIAPSGWPATPFMAVLNEGLADEEVIQVTVIAGSTITFKRASNLGALGYGSTTSSHLASATIKHVMSAVDLDEANTHTSSTGSVHGTSSALVGISDIQTLSNKTYTLPAIADFSAANHSHGNAVGGGNVPISSITDLANQLSLRALQSDLVAHTGTGVAVHGITGQVVGTTDTQTLTAKTLTSPIVNNPTVGGTVTSGAGTLTLPTSTDTLVGRATTDTLTNKSIDGVTNTLTNVPPTALAALVLPWAKAAKGVATITLGAGNSSVNSGTVIHGLGVAPTHVWLSVTRTGTEGSALLYATSLTSTTFIVHLETNALVTFGGNVDFHVSWLAVA